MIELKPRHKHERGSITMIKKFVSLFVVSSMAALVLSGYSSSKQAESATERQTQTDAQTSERVSGENAMSDAITTNGGAVIP